MLGGAHITLGIASSLLITQPDTVPGIIASITGGTVGSWVPDVDVKDIGNFKDNKAVKAIINGIFIAAFLLLDYFVGNGMISYMIKQSGLVVGGGLLLFVILLIVGHNTKHRTFTHSILGCVLFSLSFYMFCRPALVPFIIGYLSHILADLTNKGDLQIFFPAKKGLCLKWCSASGKANNVLFWICLSVDISLASYLFILASVRSRENSTFINLLNQKVVFGLSALAVYLIVINIIAFICFRIDEKMAFNRYLSGRDPDADTPMLRLTTWLLDILVFLGGGIGMFCSLVINKAYPSEYNGNWWSFCYASIVFWTTIFLFVSNPFNVELHELDLLSRRHLYFAAYLVLINIISALIFYRVRNERYDEYSLRHTGLLALGAIGGTIGGIAVIVASGSTKNYSYVSLGFYVMLISQIVFSGYLMMAGIL